MARTVRENEIIRLYDRVCARYSMPNVPVIVADEIQRQLDAMPDDENGNAVNYPGAWYGVVAPPFEGFFVESIVVVEFEGRAVVVQRGGMVYDMSDHMQKDAVAEQLGAPEGWRWCLFIRVFLFMPPNVLQAYDDVHAVVYLGADGQMLTDTGQVNIFVTQRPGLDEDTTVAQGHATAFALPMIFKAIGAMHQRCPVEEVTPSREARKRAQRDNLQLHKHYVLKVKPTKLRVLEDFKRIGKPDRPGSAEHAVRGHFRIYTKSKPLFGKYVRTIWVPAHKRGDDDYGDIKKDYEV